MIAHSDNESLNLLANQLDGDLLSKLHSDLGVPPQPGTHEGNAVYQLSVLDMSKFFRVLYNGSYLSRENSERALEILTQSTFTGGLLKGLDRSFPVAHKFGERVDGDVAQLHEGGIFYSPNKTYLLIVMSRGRSLEYLSTILSQLSEDVFRYFNPS